MFNRQKFMGKESSSRFLTPEQLEIELQSSITEEETAKITFLKEFDPNSFENYTIIIPAVSVGNIGQLALDLIIENIHPKPEKIGRIFHTALEPFVANEFDGSLMSSCEIFLVPGKELLLLQYHSPVGKEKRESFVEFLTNWIEKEKIKSVICLTSSFASERNDSQIRGTQYRYLDNNLCDSSLLDSLKRIRVDKLEPKKIDIEKNSVNYFESYNVNENQTLIPGGGISQNLHNSLTQKNISFLQLIIFASEGYNVKEAEILFRITNEVFNFCPSDFENKIKIPATWFDSHLYGGGIPDGIF